MALTVLSPDEMGAVQENIVSKRGKYHILMGYDHDTDSYFQLELTSLMEE